MAFYDPNDPADGINGYGAYRDFHSWGGRGDEWATDENGNHVRVGGTSAFDEDIARDKQMGDNIDPAAARINRAQSDESRGMTMGALGLMSARANGAVTPAQQLSQQQAQGAVSALNSSAAGIKGGAMAREAAARGAVSQGARVAAQGAQDTQALAAREQADAAGQLFGAAAGQRANDLGLATSQADLQAKQNALNETHDAFWNQQQFNTQKAQTDAELGRSAADIAATNASAATNLQEQQANLNNYKNAASTALGATTGAFSVANNHGTGTPAQPAPGPSPAPASTSSDPDDPWTHSDERTKQNVEPVTSRARIAAKTRELALSDPAAKQQAFLDGVDYAQHGHDTLGKAANVTHEYTRPDRRVPLPPTPRTVAPGGGATTFEVIKKPEMTPDKGTIKPVSPPAPAPKPKGKKHSEADPMQDANRSMVASSYEYKPGFTPSTQYEGETNVGPMANAMADDPVASTAIVRDPNSGLLAIDKEKGLKLTMGGLASLQHQVDDLKKRTA